MTPPRPTTPPATETATSDRRRLRFESSLRRGDALLALESRAARLLATSRALSFAGFSALLTELLPARRADVAKLAEAVALPETTLADLGSGTLTALEVVPDAAATLAAAMGLPEAEFRELVERDAAAQGRSDAAAAIKPYPDKELSRMREALTAAYQAAAAERGDPAAGVDEPTEDL